MFEYQRHKKKQIKHFHQKTTQMLKNTCKHVVGPVSNIRDFWLGSVDPINHLCHLIEGIFVDGEGPFVKGFPAR